MSKNIATFEDFLNENETNFRDQIESGDLIVAMFFDHTKIQYNENVLWREVIDILTQYCDFVDYCVTDTVCEFVGSPVDENIIEEIKTSLSKYTSRCTNFDVYITK
jgi:hypothetical protein